MKHGGIYQCLLLNLNLQLTGTGNTYVDRLRVRDIVDEIAGPTNHTKNQEVCEDSNPEPLTFVTEGRIIFLLSDTRQVFLSVSIHPIFTHSAIIFQQQ